MTVGAALVLAAIDLPCITGLLLGWWPGEVIGFTVFYLAWLVTIGEVAVVWHYLLVRRLVHLISTPLPVTAMLMRRGCEKHAGASQWGAWCYDIYTAKLWYPDRTDSNALEVQLYTPVTSTGGLEHVEVLGMPKRRAWVLLSLNGGFLLPKKRVRYVKSRYPGDWAPYP